MLITYTAVDGYSIESTSTGAWLMADTASDLVVDRVGNSPLKNLTANGSITTAVVASNSTTLAASGFSNSPVAYYSLPYDSAFDPGTNGLSVKIWFKTTGVSVSSNIMIHRDSATTAQNYVLAMNNDGTVYFEVDDDTSTRTAQSPSAYDDGEWHQAIGVFDGTDIYLYIDSVFVDSETGSALLTLNNGSAVFNIGTTTNLAGVEWEGSLAGVEIDIGNQWTAQTIKNKYNLEKVLFEKLELFSIVGGELTYEQSLLTASINNAVSDNFTETLNGTRSGLTWYRKKSYNCSTVPFLRSDLPAATKFLKSTNNAIFTFDERGSTSNSPNADNPITVYKTSANESISFANPYYQFAFSLRES